MKLAKYKINHDTQHIPIYTKPQPQNEEKTGFLDLPRELRDQIYHHALNDKIYVGEKVLRLYQFCLVSKQLDCEFLEAYVQRGSMFGRFCYQKRQLVDYRGGLEMPRLPLRFLCVASRCKVDIKRGIDTTTAAKCKRSMEKIASRLGEALKGASMLKELLLLLVWSGSSGEVILSRSDIIMEVLTENLDHLPNLSKVEVASGSVRWTYELKDGVWVATEKGFRTFKKPILVTAPVVASPVYEAPQTWTWVLRQVWGRIISSL